MGKSIYTYYKERLIEIGGNNKCLYLKNVVRKNAYDIGRIFEGRDEKVAEFVDFLWSNKRAPLSLISPAEKKSILENLGVDTVIARKSISLDTLEPQERQKAILKNERIKRDESQKAIESEIASLKELKREIEEIEKETGRYELYIGYPFVFGSIQQGPSKTVIKAPLLLFPVRIEIIDDHTIELFLNESEKIQLNRALLFAYAQSKRINLDGLDLEFDDLSRFKSVKAVVEYLNEARIQIDCQNSKNIYSYSRFKEPELKNDLSVRYAAVLARYPLSNSIYNDYTLLEKKNLTNDAINELLNPRAVKQKKPKRGAKAAVPQSGNYIVKMLDYAQSEVVRKVDQNGNMVIYGPPGTGKSQTIVNIITDAICKKKRILVVSQKKAALDVVFNRLGKLNEKAMYLKDETKEKQSFYERCLLAHQKDQIESLADVDAMEAEYDDVGAKIRAEQARLDAICETLNLTRPFGLSLSQMYSSSYMLPKNSTEYGIYTKMVEDRSIMALTYKELNDALFVIRSKNLGQMYYAFIQNKEKNPVIDHMRPDLDIRTLSEVQGQLEEIQKSRKGLFNTAKYPYYRQVLAYYYEIREKKNLRDVVKVIRKFEHPKLLFTAKREREIVRALTETAEAIDKFVSEYDCLHRVLTPDGYLAVIDNILRGNVSYIKLVHEAIVNYIAQRDITTLFQSLDETNLQILNFAYTISKNYQNYNDILNKFLPIRIYHEIIQFEEKCKDDLAKMMDFENITERILQLQEQQLDIANRICAGKNSREYDTLYSTAKNSKDYLYQISKKQKYWPIRQAMDVYGEFILALFPCWLLSPENVSSLLPLKKNMFDLVIFDEASQVFIESTIPTIYRGKNIVVAGDAKQLRPSATFMKRYLGGDPESQDDYSMQAALEVDSLLDLAVSRYESANLTYHYRSQYRELIDFSNAAFYGGRLQIAPNHSQNRVTRPIERYKVNGTWIDRKNVAEAKKIVELLTQIFQTRKKNETIGIITFNSDQKACIADMIDKEAARSPEFRTMITEETHRKENGEDLSIFIKNLENVQGDERDIIIFSIGYAPNEQGRVYTNFGSLSGEGGENRLNVAITRAKTKVIVVSSIEPEDLKVEGAKNLGPKLLRNYLAYVRAVANGDDVSANAVLADVSNTDTVEVADEELIGIEEQMKERLTKLGYTVETRLGNQNSRISLAVYDKKTDRYLVGVELDKDAFASSESVMERDVYKPRFIESRGWTLVRVWCRDWWLSPQKVVRMIASIAEKNKVKR